MTKNDPDLFESNGIAKKSNKFQLKTSIKPSNKVDCITNRNQKEKKPAAFLRFVFLHYKKDTRVAEI